ncbi:hypothetical protein CDCA_CDCA16G4250 [Cyanidium caldarium]|uniref:anthranilate synthase n=1 Tax=Cyanidium caldarium TaxID=2771 RepID=A0AAV9J1M6_CYACA|nr:hypothetical protein CDCA_CDCA16G4250 [Cyanidium caldarium]
MFLNSATRLTARRRTSATRITPLDVSLPRHDIPRWRLRRRRRRAALPLHLNAEPVVRYTDSFREYYQSRKVPLPSSVYPVTLFPLHRRIFADRLTPVVAYRALVSSDAPEQPPSFLLESVVGGDQVGRYSYVGTEPAAQVIAHQQRVELWWGSDVSEPLQLEAPDPWVLLRQLTEQTQLAAPAPVAGAFCGGWVGYGGYDTVRYAESKKMPFSAAPPDDRGLPDLHFSLFREVVVFDNVNKSVSVVVWVAQEEHASAAEAQAYGERRLEAIVGRLTLLEAAVERLPPGQVSLETLRRPVPMRSNMSKATFMKALERIHEHVLDGNTFQTVFSQRFERETRAPPFEIYRALRIVNPSPYMIYLRVRGSRLIASSPEILCKTRGRKVWNRPLAGTRRRGATADEDEQLERELLADEKDRCEHVMLVDLGRNDVGRVARFGTVKVERFFEIERYSHVMHISSTITGELWDELTCWDALRATLPAGTISGAPKVRSMQIIDELELNKRGPYGGGIGYVSFGANEMDIALALRTMVVPDALAADAVHGPWTVHIQAGAGIVYASDPESEYQETVNKAAALGRAIDLAEQAFLGQAPAEAPETVEAVSTGSEGRA